MVAPAVAEAAKERLVAPETHLVFPPLKEITAEQERLAQAPPITAVAEVAVLLLLALTGLDRLAVTGAPEHHRQFLVRL
jgi:hypothetical protein